MKEEVMQKLQFVKDPEIPSISVIELGMIEAVIVGEREITIKALPTFVGCPALELIKCNMIDALAHIKENREIKIEFIYDPPWTSERISDVGREKLKEYGIAPPPEFLNDGSFGEICCPYCDSRYTTLENLFGPTACRCILYCKSCKNPFEAMRPVSNLM
nr:1,2-phenylacetyl-CoA epoxidase subunit PaaD [Bacillus sp. FJAT-50079]